MTETERPRELARAQAAHILSQKFANRDRVKAKLFEEQEAARVKARAGREATRRRWKIKTQYSPFLVDLVAENERLDEENKVRLAADANKHRLLEKRRVTLKQQVIARALREESDLDSLRREKRAIVDEERRLKALLDLEKTQTRSKVDMLAAERAERQRGTAIKSLRRRGNVDRLRKERFLNLELLRATADVPAKSDWSF
mmetsp:Transcript_5207/g.16422  ORF Transcript_5207/g.16422 Transcript_5207/m.16422 type:complete len:201 (-) Transcript_5207:402-1004(-)